MALLKYTNQAPPGNWKYKQLETGLTITGDSLQDLVSKTVAHRRYKGLTPIDAPTVAVEIQRQICTRLGKDDCKEESGTDPWVPVPISKRFTLEDMLAFSKTALEFVKNGGEMVPMEEALRRREICLACPLNQPATGCKCGLFYRMIKSIMPKVRQWDDLHVCGICHCSNSVKVNVPMEIIQKDRRKLDFPVPCWQHPSNILPPAK